MVVLLNIEDVVKPLNVLHQQLAVRMVMRDLVLVRLLCFHIVTNQLYLQFQMNSFQDDAYIFWKNKWDLAVKGDPNAVDDMKIHIQEHINKQHPFFSTNYATLLKQSRLYQIEKQENYGNYELYSKVPIFLVLEGSVELQCINMEGDNQTIASTQKAGILQVNETELRNKFGDNNITLITQFQIVGIQKSVVIQLNTDSVAACIKHISDKLDIRQECIMKRYMLIALKHITKLTFSKDIKINERFYLLDGKACYYHFKSKTILSCYEEGLFNPKDMQNQQIRLHIFEGAYIMVLQGQMLKDQVAQGVQVKREQHLKNIWNKYLSISPQQKDSIQSQLIKKYKLNKSQVEKDILGIQKTVEKRVKSKNDMIQTSSSIKQKCGIRIRRTKRAI